MVNEFKQYIKRERLLDDNTGVLLAVSGGVDSMVMLHLFIKAGFNVSIAHCNFQLRGEDSNGDAAFVEKIAKSYGIPFYIKHFQTVDYAQEKGISIQMAARALRFSWFFELVGELGYKAIATAHHLDDDIETFFINLLRGSGVAGLRGLMPKQENGLIHPLLFMTREQIEQYAEQNGVSYRNDITNTQTKYLRNNIRHTLLPQLQQMSPNYRDVFHKTFNRFSHIEDFLKYQVEKIASEISHPYEDGMAISVDRLKGIPGYQTILHYLLNPMGFNEDVLMQVSAAMSGCSGKQFYSPTHRLVIDRGVLLVASNVELSAEEYMIDSPESFLMHPITLELSVGSCDDTFKASKLSNIATLDGDKIQFPLVIRRWRKGDWFLPYGMNGKKKLSDFFIDKKLSVVEKEQVWLLCSANKDVMWIMGYRIDRRYAISPSTRRVLTVKWDR